MEALNFGVDGGQGGLHLLSEWGVSDWEVSRMSERVSERVSECTDFVGGFGGIRHLHALQT